MKLKDLIPIFNEQLKVLEGKKFKESYELHDMKKEALMEIASKFGFKISIWSMDYELGNDIVYKDDKRVFEINVDTTDDKRVKWSWAGKINSITVNISKDMEYLRDVDLNNLNKFYIKKTLEDMIESQKEEIQKAEIELKRREDMLTVYEEAYLQVKEDVELPSEQCL